MANFIKNSEDLNRLDWKLLREGFVIKILDQEVLDKTVEWLKKNEYTVYEFDCKNWKKREDIDAAYLSVLQANYSNCSNLDGLVDCISEIDFQGKTNSALIFRNANQIAVSLGKEYLNSMLDVIYEQSRIHALFGNRVLALVGLDQDLDLEIGPQSVVNSSVLLEH